MLNRLKIVIYNKRTGVVEIFELRLDIYITVNTFLWGKLRDCFNCISPRLIDIPRILWFAGQK